MLKQLFLICLILFYFVREGRSQPTNPASIKFTKKEVSSLPGKIINIPFFIKNNTPGLLHVTTKISLPAKWNVITNVEPVVIKPSEQKFSIFSIQIPSNYPVGNYPIYLSALNADTGEVFEKKKTNVKVLEIENISMQLIESPEHITAGKIYKATYMLQNLGNTIKKVFIETSNCDIEGNAEIKLKPGESSQITIFKQTFSELTSVKEDYFTVRALLSGITIKSIFRSIIIFPIKNNKKDLFFRLPVKASITYLSSNQLNKYQSAYQFELSGSGALDPEGKHHIEFLARGPNSVESNFLGMYDQYYISYLNKNVELSVGEKSYNFTPLTESSRFGLGVENKVILNNGLAFGFLYVKPRFYTNITNEMALYSQFEKNKNNSISVYYVLKKDKTTEDLTYLTSINTKFKLLKNTDIDLELSRGTNQGIADNAFRTNLNTHFLIFRATGNYFYTGKDYPGYYSNSTFYSGSFSAQVTKKINLGVSSRQDFQNAQLDTFFVTAPYSKSFQSYINYNIAPRTHLNLYWRDYERKDRLALAKFHYKTKSINSQFNQRFKKIEYSLLGEYGKTTNLLLGEIQNQQNTYRGSANFSYRFNLMHAVRVFGSWSNINSFVSGKQRNLTTGLSVSSQISKNLRANFHIQNAYDIDDYYRNRNLMQLNVDYRFLKKHTFTFRSYYTIFKKEIGNPEFFLSATYAYNFGIPIKQIMKAGDIKGRITNDDDEGLEGIMINLLNKKTLTDKNGEFSFRSVQPGKLLLSVDHSKFEIDEIPNIPTPIEIEVIEDRESSINFKIIKGAKLFGKFSIKENNGTKTQLNNIIVELKSDFKQYRITTDKEGDFSFPIILPGSWIFNIYDKSIPSGCVIDKKLYNFNFTPGERNDLQIEIKRKKRNIIFKSQNFSLSTSRKEMQKIKSLKMTSNVQGNKPANPDNLYYSIQIGVFRKRIKPTSLYFRKKPFDFEKQMNNFYKYFIGKYSLYEEALKERNRIQSIFKDAFIVIFENDKLLYPNNKENQ